MRPYPFVIPAGKSESVGVTGNYVRLASISGASSLVVKCLQTGEEVELESGDSAKLTAFKELFLSHSAAGDVTVKLYVGENTEASSSKVSGDISVAAAPTLEDVADVSLLAGVTTQILAADSTRREVIIRNLKTNTQTFRIGTSNAGAARGMPLDPNESITLRTTDAVYGYNPGGAAESVAVLITKG